MNAVLWIAAGLLALTFLAAGGYKVSRPKEKRSTRTWGRFGPHSF